MMVPLKPTGRAWSAAAVALAAACLAMPASASDGGHGSGGHDSGGHGAAPSAPRSGKPIDPLTLIQGASNGWSVSRTEAGCYLMSPYRADTSRLAFGQHPTFGLGLFAVSLRLALPRGTTDEPVAIQADGWELKKVGQMTGGNLLFVALDRAEAEASLRELGTAGTLWLVVRNTSIAHSGQAVQAAIAEYGRACANAGGPAG